MTTEAIDPAVPPMPFVVASWLGYPLEHIVEGLRRGTISPPEGAPPGWLPPGAEAPAPVDDGASATSTPEGDAAMPNENHATTSDAVDGADDAAPAVDLRATCFDLVRAIDASLDEATFDALWRSAGGDDATRAADVRDLLWRTVAGTPAPDDDAGTLASAIAGRGTHGTLVSLTGEGSGALADRARRDPSVLGALVAGDEWAFAQVGEGAGAATTRFDPVTGEANVSDAWIDDRAKLAAWRSALREDPAASDGVATSWRFVDREPGEAGTLALGASAGEANQVVFARDGGDTVTGGARVDRLHGGSGDDALDGGDGDDLVEGARGDDALAGGEGDDSLDGGAGDDTLAGGTGDDRLAGGSGHDRYAFARGDGTDVIDDSDGDGEIVLDGAALTGMEREVGFTTERDGVGGTTLVVTTGAPNDASASEIRVRDWRDGDLGIRLASGADSVDAGAQWLPDLHASDAAPHAAGPWAALKPFVTADASASAYARESGNEAGLGLVAGDALPMHAATTSAASALGRVGVVEVADVVQALRATPGSGSGDAIAAPPGVDPGAVTFADVAGALADIAGDHDDADAAFDAVRLPWWELQDGVTGHEPPGVPSRRGG